MDARASGSDGTGNRKQRRVGLSLERLEGRRLLTSFVVSGTGDSGPGSFRQAILDSNAAPAPLGQSNVIDFAPGFGPALIEPLSSLPAITDSVVIDTGVSPINPGQMIVVDGSQAGDGVDGLTIEASGVVIRGLAIQNFSGNGISIIGGGNDLIDGNVLGADDAHVTPFPGNGGGLGIGSSTNDTISGNVISGNKSIGVNINQSSGILLQGNLVGLDPLGLFAIPNTFGGISLTASTNDTIGGTASGSGNVISGNDGDGLVLSGGSNGDLLEGNLIGLDSSGTFALPNKFSGVTIDGSTKDTIGGTVSGAANGISGNDGIGVSLINGSTGTLIQGNFIGTDLAGENPVANQGDGVSVDSSPGNTIGGSSSGARNVISSNVQEGIKIVGTDSRNNLIQGNDIGTDALGQKDLGNLIYGIWIDDAGFNLIGGSGPGEGNLISANQLIGVQIFGANATGNVLLGNTIGLDASGTIPLPNGGDGVYLFEAPGNVIGGALPGDRNIISGNGFNGVEVFGQGSTGNLIEGNYLGTGPTGTDNQGNTLNGVEINNASGNTIGGTTPGSANLISGNRLNGVQIVVSTVSESATGNLIEGNFIGTDDRGTGFNASGIFVSPGNANDGVQIDAIDGNVSGNTIGGTGAGSGNVISGNGGNGVEVLGPNFHVDQTPNAQASGQLIAGNIIGLDGSGTNRLANSQDGILVRFANGVTIGGTSSGARNVISANQQAGISINQSDFLTVQGNVIGGDASGSFPLGNIGNGVSISFNAGNTIGGGSSGAGNLIFGNGGSGISMLSTSANAILGNTIGLNASDQSISAKLNPDGSPQLIGNHNDGVTLDLGSSSNTIGGTDPGDRNVISANLKNGITVINASDTNTIEGNYVGLDQTGLSGQGNKLNGVYLTTTGNTVGGTASGAANVVSGNLNSGVVLSGSSATNNQVEGNFIGTNFRGGVNPDGTPPDVGSDNQPIGNRQDGVFVNDDAIGNTIGGTLDSARNVISGNGSNGIQVLGININSGAVTGLSGNIIAGNFIGTDASGLAADGNAASGVFLYNARGNVVGAPGSGGNVISGNLGSGVAIQGEAATNNVVLGNRIGTDALGTSPLGNSGDGVTLVKADFNQIGGLGTGEANVILGNGGTGVSISTSNSPIVAGNVIAGNMGDGVSVASGSNNALIFGNKVGVDASGEVAVGNHLDGVRLANAGLNAQVISNLISANQGAGVEVSGTSSTALIQTNLIGLDASGTIEHGNAVGVLIDGVTDVVVGGLVLGTGNFISGNSVGVEVSPATDTSLPLGDLIAGNVIGLDISGERAIGNDFGVFLNDSVGVTVGGTSSAARNVISGNIGVGVQVFRVSEGGTGDTIEGNFIGLDQAGLAVPAGALQPIGVFLNSASNNTVGGTIPGSSNVISGNTTGDPSTPSYGVSIFGQSAAMPLDNVVVGNLIGTDANGKPLLNSARVPIQTNGVAINLSSGNLIGGGDPSSRNTIAGNLVGVQIAGSVQPLTGFTAGNTVEGDTIDANTFGVFLTSASHNAIVGNDLSLNTSIGLSIIGSGSSSNVAMANRIFGNGSAASGALASGTIGDGVYIESAVGNTITANAILANGYVGANPANGVGVYVFDNASGNKVTHNTIAKNTGYGILVYNSASNLASIPLNGKAANTLSGNGIASFREYTGPVTTSTSTTTTSAATIGSSTPRGPKPRKKSR